MAHNLRKRVKCNNNGSTMVIVLIMLSFVMILATVVTSSTIMNLKMKVANKQSAKTFYTSEDAVNEIYVAMGQMSSDCFNSAYQDQVAKMVVNTESGITTVDNITCNKELRLDYIHRMLNKLGMIQDNMLDSIKYKDDSDYVSKKQEGVYERGGSTIEAQGIVSVLNDCIEATHKSGSNTLDVESIDNIQIVSKKSQAEENIFYYTININNCLVKYLTQAGYYSYITFDMTLGIPDKLVNITDSKKLSLDSFLRYAIVGNKGISVASNASFNLNGNAFAGSAGGFKVNPAATANVAGDTLLATSGDIVVENGTLNAGNGGTGNRIWCENIKTSDSTGGTSSITVNGSSDTYVRDDLELNGSNSKVKLSGNYYGYSYVGVNATEKVNRSSAIVINGTNSELDLQSLNKLLVSGRAYIDYYSLANADGYTVPGDYDTGESVSFIGNQEIYLVPAALMGGETNPAAAGTNVNITISEDNFFGYKYLSEAEGKYFVKKTITIGSLTRDYYYLRFKDEKAAASYVKAIFDDTEFNSLLSGKSDKVKKTYKEQRERLKSQMTLNAQSLNSVIKAGSGSVYTKNSMLSAVAAADGSMSLVYNESDDAASSTKYDYAGDYEDLASRFNVLSRTLYEITDTKKMNNTIIGQMYPDLNKYSKEVYVNIISTIGLEAYTKDKLGPVTTKLTGGYDKYALVAFNNSNSTSEPLIISNNDEVIRKKTHMSNDITYSFRDVDGGVIVASGDVVVKKNFSGTIIAGGTITIEGNVTVTGLSDTTDIIKTDQKYAEIFKVWNPLENSNDSGFLDVQNMTYKDMIRVANWRKRDDSEKTTQSTEAVTTK